MEEPHKSVLLQRVSVVNLDLNEERSHPPCNNPAPERANLFDGRLFSRASPFSKFPHSFRPHAATPRPLSRACVNYIAWPEIGYRATPTDDAS